MNARRTLLILSRVTMEGAWLSALVALCSLLTGASHAAMPGIAIFGLVFLAYGIGHMLQHLEIPESHLRLIGTVVAIAAVNGIAKLLVTGHWDFWNLGWPFGYVGGGEGTFDQGRQTILALGMGIVLWWRGLRLAEDVPLFDEVLMAFRSGIILVAIQVLLEGFVPLADGASAMPIPFFVAGLLALSLAHLERVDRNNAIGFQGLGALLPLATIGAIAALGIVLGILPYGELGRSLASLGKVVEFATNFVVLIVVLGAGFVAEFIINSVNWLLSFMNRRPYKLELPVEQAALENIRQQSESGGVPMWFFDAVRISILAVLVLIALVLLARAFRRRQERMEETQSEDRTSLWNREPRTADLPLWLQRLLSGLTGRDVDEGSSGREGVLHLYFRMLRRAARFGVLREHWRTPLEFRSELLKTFQGREASVERITLAFVSARYGDRFPSVAELRNLEDAVQLLENPEPPAPSEQTRE